MKINNYAALVLISVIFALSIPLVVLADTFGSGLLQESAGGVGLEGDLTNSAANVVSTILAVTGTMFLVLTVAAGIMWMTASGNEEKIAKAKKIIIGAVIGLGVCLSAYTITYFVSSRMSAGAGGATQTCTELGGTCVEAGLGGPTLNGSCQSGEECAETAAP
jgi:preprotein translocase subunit SecG